MKASRTSGGKRLAACANHSAPAAGDFAWSPPILNGGFVASRGSVGLRPNGRSTDGASIVKAWLAPSVGCRVQRGWAPREPLVDARDADMVMIRDTFGLWASGRWHSYHGTQWYNVQGIQGREKRGGQRPSGLLPPLGWSVVVAGQSNRDRWRCPWFGE